MDRLIKLIEIRSDNKRRFFYDFVEPIFLDLLAIHEDYSKTFLEVSLIMGNLGIPKWKVVEKVERQRAELEAIREKLSRLIDELDRVADSTSTGWPVKGVRPFITVSRSYFHAGAGKGSTLYPSNANKTGQTWYTTLLDMIYIVGLDQQLTRQECAKIVEDMNRDIHGHWSSICIEYSRLRVSCLK